MTGFGIFAYFGYDLPLEESLRRLAAAGFDTVSLFWGAFDGGPPLHRQPELARRAGVPVTNYGMAISECHGMLERVLSPFREALDAYRREK